MSDSNYSLQESGHLSLAKKKKKNVTPTEEMRKNNHKMIEQRRRQKINDKIEELREILAPQHTEGFPNKSAILESTIDSIKSLRGTYNKLVIQQKLLQDEHIQIEKELDIFGIKAQPFDFDFTDRLSSEISNNTHAVNPPKKRARLIKEEEEDESEEEDEEEVEQDLPNPKQMRTRSSSQNNVNVDAKPTIQDKELLQNIIKNNSTISPAQLASLFSNNYQSTNNGVDSFMFQNR